MWLLKVIANFCSQTFVGTVSRFKGTLHSYFISLKTYDPVYFPTCPSKLQVSAAWLSVEPGAPYTEYY
jgi:hypothetical protein